MTRIFCPACRSTEGFTLVRDVRIATDVDANGVPEGGVGWGVNQFSSEGRRRWLNCRGCGHSWPTRRYFDIEVDVR